MPKLSSPHSESLPASIRFPKNFQPVGVSYNCIWRALATLEQIGAHKKPHKKAICNRWEVRTFFNLHKKENFRLAVVWFLLVQGSTGRHTAGQSFDSSLLEVRDAGNVGSDDSHWVWGVHEKAVFTQNHVTVLKTERRANKVQESQITARICDF